MDSIILLAIVIPVGLLLIGVLIGIISSHSKYFDFEDADARFYMKKHAVFRLFGIMYNFMHYILSIFAVIFTLVTVYMVLDSSMGAQRQIFFLLMAAIFSTLSNTIKLNEVSRTYFTAMRMLESAILTYKGNKDVNLLIRANQEAEALIGEKFV